VGVTDIVEGSIKHSYKWGSGRWSSKCESITGRVGCPSLVNSMYSSWS